MRPDLRPADLLVAGYNLMLLCIWSGLMGEVRLAPWIAGGHAMALALPWLLAPRESSWTGAGAVAALREIYPLLLLLPFWTELGWLYHATRPAGNDGAIGALDLALFGRHLNLMWMPAMPQTWLSELMHFCYFLYYALIFVPPIVVGLRGRLDALRDMTLGLMVTYLGCYVVYLVYPVIGPAELMPHYQGELTQGLFYRLTHAARDAGDSLGTAFPSSHAAGAVTAAWLGWRWFGRPVAVLLTVQAGGVLLATVYTQNHYAVDAVAGLVWALGLQAIAVPAILRLFQPASEPALVPLLPARWTVWPEPVTGGSR